MRGIPVVLDILSACGIGQSVFVLCRLGFVVEAVGEFGLQTVGWMALALEDAPHGVVCVVTGCDGAAGGFDGCNGGGGGTADSDIDWAGEGGGAASEQLDAASHVVAVVGQAS